MTDPNSDPTRSFYDRISKAYDALADSNEHTAREEGLSLLAVAGGERVLEVGYGTGHSLVALAEAVGSDGKVFGIDISDGMHDTAAKRVQEAGMADRVDLRVGVTPPLPYEDDSFDAVTMSFTLELFPLDVIPEVLKEIRRVLRDGGRLGVVCMATTPKDQSDSLLERTYKWMHQHFPHIVDCQPIDAVTLLEAAGFEVAAQSSIQIRTMPVLALVGRPTSGEVG